MTSPSGAGRTAPTWPLERLGGEVALAKMRKRVLAACLLLGAAAGQVAGQERGPGWAQCRADIHDPNTVRGRLYPAAGDPHLDRAVFLARVPEGGQCQVSADSTGSFEFRGVPSGAYEVRLGMLGLQHLSPIPVEVETGDTVELVIPVAKENWVVTCLGKRECARIITTVPSVERGASASEGLRLAGYRIALAVAQEGAEAGSDWVACVDAGERTLTALREVHPDVDVGQECEMGPGRAGTAYGERLRHGPSGRLARAVGLDRVEAETRDEAVVHVSYHVAGLWGAGFSCRVIRVGRMWMPDTCEMTWVS